MNNKELKYSFNVVLEAARKVTCKDLHHKPKQYHDCGEMCPAEAELYKHINIIRGYMKGMGL